MPITLRSQHKVHLITHPHSPARWVHLLVPSTDGETEVGDTKEFSQILSK